MLKKIPSLTISLLTAFAFCFYVPAVSFLSNPNEFPFGLQALMQAMCIPFACLTGVLLLLLTSINRGFAAEKDAQGNAVENPPSPAHVVLLVIVLCLWLEGFLLNIGLPRLTGEKDLFNSMQRLILDSAVWLVPLVAGLIFWRYLGKRLHILAPCLALCLGFGIADAYMSSPPKLPVTVTANQVLGKIRFHPSNNVVVLLLDAMSTALVKDFIEEEPKAKEELSGFVLFENNVQSGSSTQFSLPSILRGDMYTGGDPLQYQRETFNTGKSLPETFAAKSYHVYVSSFLPIFNRLVDDESEALDASIAVAAAHVTPAMYGLFFVRFSPYALKNIIANNVGFVPNAPDKMLYEGYSSYDALAYALFTAAVGQKSNNTPSFHFHHINGAHLPYITAADGGKLAESERFTLRGLREQSEWTLRSIIQLLKAMKRAGMYDSSTIVLLGDHDDRQPNPNRTNAPYAEFASLLIKPAGSEQPFSVSQAPTSNMYLAQFIPALHLSGQTLESLTQNLPTQRSLYVGGEVSEVRTYTGVDVTTLRVVNSKAVEQDIPPPAILVPNTRYTCSMLEKNPNIAFPLSLENADFLNGWGIKTQHAPASLAFKVQPGLAMVNLTLGVLYDSPTGRKFQPYDLIVRDTVSQREKTFLIQTEAQDIHLDAVQIDADSSLRLQIISPEDSFEYITIVKSIRLNPVEHTAVPPTSQEKRK